MKPRLPIRRFDVFAEFNRLEALKKGMDEAHAKGYGLWVAKVVASGGGRRGSRPPAPAEAGERREAPEERPARPAEAEEWRTLGDEPQTDRLFNQEIVRRMGEDFYREVFAPAVAEAFRQGKSYTAIRDTIRKDWKP